jgi:serine/threonine protein kinase
VSIQAAASPSEVSFVAASPIELVQSGLPRRLGRYELRSVLGAGSFGTVFQAFDPELARDVAIKVPRGELLRSPKAVDSYLAEARVLATLDHPGIVPVYDCGRTDDGLCYVVSKLVDGSDLSRVMAQGLSSETAAKLIAIVAEALHYAHKRGLIHCDIKPANILVAADGNPIVADFGLAVREQTQSQQSGMIAGTPSYMSPEQTRGERHRLDGRADIWALGVILYELLTRRHPFSGDTAAQILDEIAHREPKPPRMIDDTIPPELERITLRCLAKDIRDRYCTAADLAADLTRWSSAATTELISVGAVRRATRPRKVALWACVVCGAVVTVGFLGIRGFQPAPLAHTNASAPLSGDVKVQVFSSDKSSLRQGLSLEEPGALPLRKDDRVRVEAALNRPAYVYLIWIASDGKVSPVYPWPPGDWKQRPNSEQMTDRISLPEPIDKAWRVYGGPGMETFVLLAREEPLPGDVNLESMLSGLPAQKLRDEQAVVWLDPADRLASRRRGLKFDDAVQLDDSVLKTQKLLTERLGQYFALIRAVSFANKGQ